MSKTKDPSATTDMTVKVRDYTEQTAVVTQYGMRYPDGTIQWDKDDNTNYTVRFDSIVAGNSVTSMDWRRVLEKRAKTANIDVDDYASQHQLIKRTVVLAVTTAEDVTA